MQTVFVGLVDDVRKELDMSGENPQRVITVTGRGVSKAFITFELAQVPEYDFQGPFGGWMSLKLNKIAGANPAELLEEAWTALAKPYVNYNFSSGTKLFDLIGRNFKSRSGLVLQSEASLINWQSNLWAFFKEVSDPPFHELFWEIGPGTNAPILTLRPTPFSNDGENNWNDLPSVLITDEDVVVEQLGRSDVETYTMFSVGMKIGSLLGDNVHTFGIPPLWHDGYASKYGTRRLHVESLYAAYHDEEDKQTVMDIIHLYQKDLYNWNILNNSMFNGMLVVKGSNQYKVGTRLRYESKEDNTTMEYYIISVSHNFVNFGSWVTMLGVTRGCIPKDRFASPYNAPQEYTHAPWLPQVDIMTIDSSTNLLMGIGGGTGEPPGSLMEIASQVISFAKSLVGKVKYVFGSDDASTLTFDCSSFVQYVFRKAANMEVGRNTQSQIKAGSPVDRANLYPGNIILFDPRHTGTPTHAAIYIGNNQIVHNVNPKENTTISSLDEPYYNNGFMAARNVFINQPVSGGGRTLKVSATAYTCPPQNSTYSGVKPVKGITIATDKSIIAMGTKLKITCPDYPSVNGEHYIAQDTGSAIKGNKIDIFFGYDYPGMPNHWDNYKEACKFGRRDVIVTILS
ncbi:MAG: NlpC/P60 family protein [Bacteroidota bacterium]|nr:NlpC/P60 family protein [Bacteroidota bacterium]